MTCRKKTCHGRAVPRSLSRKIPACWLCCRPCLPLEPSCLGLETLRLTSLAPSLSSPSCLASGVSLRPARCRQSLTKRALTREVWKNQCCHLLTKHGSAILKRKALAALCRWGDSRDLGCLFSAGCGLWAATVHFPQGRVREPENDKGVLLYTQAIELLWGNQSKSL